MRYRKNRSLCVPVRTSVSNQYVILKAIDEQPVGLDVALAASRPDAAQGVVAVFLRQRLTVCKERDGLRERLQFQAALPCQLIVPSELRRKGNGILCSRAVKLIAKALAHASSRSKASKSSRTL